MKRIYFFIFIQLGLLNAQDLPTAKWENINYAGNNEVHHMMDIYLPDQGSKIFPVVITIYGSAWRANDKKGSKYIKKSLIQP
ncbi:MAG: hypothetical protein L7U59_06205, partial [Flavobacteriaceae bacterium]|nr:hypothetical protein [Flavobacteriaceae bacterium]